MFKGKKLILFLSILLVFMLLLSACGSNKPADTTDQDVEETDVNGEDTTEETTEDSGDGELIVAQGADPVSLDPHASNDQPSSRVNKQIYDTLVEATEDMELKPGLAEDWEQIDENTWKFIIRQGVKFHNGE